MKPRRDNPKADLRQIHLSAKALQLSVALVIAVQMLRLFLVMFLAEPLFICW